MFKSLELVGKKVLLGRQYCRTNVVAMLRKQHIAVLKLVLRIFMM